MKYSILLLALFSSLVITSCVKKRTSTVRQYPASTNPATIPKATASGSTISNQEIETALALHNQIRANVGVPPLSWSSSAAQHIQNWVNHLAATNCKLTHRPNNQYGENLFMGTKGYYRIESAIKSWESEKKSYHGEPLSNSNLFAVGHYTQVVWRNTTQVGCAKAVCQNNVIIGCNYAPAGNYLGEKPY